MSHFAPISPRRPPSTARKVIRAVVGLAALAGLMVGCLAIVATSPPLPPTPAISPATTWDTPREAARPAVDTQAADGSLAGDGTYIVGVDVAPGTYRSKGADDVNGVCYWARLDSTLGDTDSIIANDGGKGAQVVTVKKTDKAFTSRGCAEWTKAS